MSEDSKRPVRIVEAEPLSGLAVRLRFSDGLEKTVDLGRHLHGPVFEPLRRDEALFRSAVVDPELGTIVWPNGADLDPDVLYFDRIPAEEEDAASAHDARSGRTMPW